MKPKTTVTFSVFFCLYMKQNVNFVPKKFSMQNITSKEWQEKTAIDTDAVILDVRTDEEVAEGIIFGAKQINIQDPAHFMEEIQKLDTSKNYYVYCRSGGRSAQACAVLNSLGIQNTFNLLGGITEWDGRIDHL